MRRWTFVCSVPKTGKLSGAVPVHYINVLAIEMNFGYKTVGRGFIIDNV